MRPAVPSPPAPEPDLVPGAEPILLPGPDGAPTRGAAAFLATLQVYEGWPPELLDEAPPDTPQNRS